MGPLHGFRIEVLTIRGNPDKPLAHFSYLPGYLIPDPDRRHKVEQSGLPKKEHGVHLQIYPGLKKNKD